MHERIIFEAICCRVRSEPFPLPYLSSHSLAVCFHQSLLDLPQLNLWHSYCLRILIFKPTTFAFQLLFWTTQVKVGHFIHLYRHLFLPFLTHQTPPYFKLSWQMMCPHSIHSSLSVISYDQLQPLLGLWTILLPQSCLAYPLVPASFHPNLKFQCLSQSALPCSFALAILWSPLWNHAIFLLLWGHYHHY